MGDGPPPGVPREDAWVYFMGQGASDLTAAQLAKARVRTERFVSQWQRGTADRGYGDMQVKLTAANVARQARSERELLAMIRRTLSTSHLIGDDEDAKIFIDTAMNTYRALHGIDESGWIAFGLYEEYLHEQKEARRRRVGEVAQEIERERERQAKQQAEQAAWLAYVNRLARETGLDPEFIGEFLRQYTIAQRPRHPGRIAPLEVPFIRQGLISTTTAPLRPVGKLILDNLEILVFLKGFIPGVGLLESIVGEDLITGRELEAWERVLGATLDLIPLVGKGVKATVRVGRATVRVGRATSRGFRGLGGAARLSRAMEEAASGWAAAAVRRGLQPEQMLDFIGRISKLSGNQTLALLRRIRSARRSRGVVRLSAQDRKLIRGIHAARQRLLRTAGTLADRGFELARGALRKALEREPIAAASLGPLGTAATRQGFRTALERKLKAKPSHPLAFLLHKGRLRSSTARGVDQEVWGNMPEIVEAGHAASAKSLTGRLAGTDRFMVMSAHHNRLMSATIEHPRKGAWMRMRQAIEISGIPVHIETAVDWVAKGLLDPKALAAARPVRY